MPVYKAKVQSLKDTFLHPGSQVLMTRLPSIQKKKKGGKYQWSCYQNYWNCMPLSDTDCADD